MTRAAAGGLPADFVFAAADTDKYVRQFLATAANYVLDAHVGSRRAAVPEAVVRIHPEK
ncbi:MAG: hypothetical protein GY798_29395 [Hyphomicrobiales bacterium]|nr:hypothetical protein [Hyphomicrobiales bacterium]